MKPIENYYEYLSISEKSSQKAIQKAYKKKSLLVHPDKLKVDSSEEFNKLKSVYDILSDPAKKAAYDKQLFETKAQERLEAEMSERHRKLREQFRVQEEAAKNRKIEKEKEQYSNLRKHQIMRQDAEDVLLFDRQMQAKRRKRVENIIESVSQSNKNHSDTEYTEDEVMKMMGL